MSSEVSIPKVVSISPEIAPFTPLIKAFFPLSPKRARPPANLICTVGKIKRKIARVLLLPHKIESLDFQVVFL